MKPTMFNHAETVEQYMYEVRHMSFDELCMFIHQAYDISYELGLFVSERMLDFL